MVSKHYLRAAVHAFQAHRSATLPRLRRVNQALSQWDEVEAAAAVPADLRPQVEPPTLSRTVLKELQAVPGLRDRAARGVLRAASLECSVIACVARDQHRMVADGAQML